MDVFGRRPSGGSSGRCSSTEMDEITANALLDGIADYTDLLSSHRTDVPHNQESTELFDGEHLLRLPSHITDDIIENFLSSGGGDYAGEDNSSDSGVSSGDQCSVKQEPMSPLDPYFVAVSPDVVCNVNSLGAADSGEVYQLSADQLYQVTEQEQLAVASILNDGSSQHNIHYNGSGGGVSLLSPQTLLSQSQAKLARIEPKPEILQNNAGGAVSPDTVVYTIHSNNKSHTTQNERPLLVKLDQPPRNISPNTTQALAPNGGQGNQVHSKSASMRALTLAANKNLSEYEKKQARMIKNREAATLSRKRRKEHMEQLEDQLQQVQNENDRLEKENLQLRELVHNLRLENSELKKESGFSLAPPTKRKVASSLVLAVCFLFTFNAFSYPSHSSVHVPINQSHQALNTISQSDSSLLLLPKSSHHMRRHLLSLDSGEIEEELVYPPPSESLNSSSKSQYHLKNTLPKKEYKRPVRPTATQKVLYSGVNLSTPSRSRLHTDNTSLSAGNLTMGYDSTTLLNNESTSVNNSNLMILTPEEQHLCASEYLNSTDSLRLANELAGWALRSKIAAKFNTKPPKNAPTVKSTKHTTSSGETKQKRGSSNRASNKKRPTRRYPMELYNTEEQRRTDHLYYQAQKVLEALQRRNDTFYVVSFHKDHWLLPAVQHNNTSRPKMSIVMPSLNLNDTMKGPEGTITMMQIDCEVMDTKYIHVERSLLQPEHDLRIALP